MTRSIAIVEDETNIAMALTFMLRREGFETGHIDDGQAAMDALRASPPDLVLLDVMLPHVSGFELCQQIRLDPILKNTRIVLMIAAGGGVERRKGLALGADDFVQKPFDIGELIGRVKELTGAGGGTAAEPKDA